MFVRGFETKTFLMSALQITISFKWYCMFSSHSKELTARYKIFSLLAQTQLSDAQIVISKPQMVPARTLIRKRSKNIATSLSLERAHFSAGLHRTDTSDESIKFDRAESFASEIDINSQHPRLLAENDRMTTLCGKFRCTTSCFRFSPASIRNAAGVLRSPIRGRFTGIKIPGVERRRRGVFAPRASAWHFKRLVSPRECA